MPTGYASDLALTEDGLVLVSDYEEGLFILSGDAFVDHATPAPIQNLAGEPNNFTTVDMSWIATGDDGLFGRADHYELRWADNPITDESDWTAATPVSATPTPEGSGSVELMQVDGFSPGQIAHFCIRAYDEVGHESGLSQSAMTGTYSGTVLKDGTVSPRVGEAIQEPFVFEIVYLDENENPPLVRKDLELDGELLPMSLISGEPYTGSLYRVEATLEAGAHDFRFIFDNGEPSGYVETALDEELYATLGVTYTQGSPLEELGRDLDEVQTEVSILDNLSIGAREVTQAEWVALMGATEFDYIGDNLPAHNIDWYEALAYCNALSASDGHTPAYEINGYSVAWDREANGWRLPTEAEWEWFCRADSDVAFCGGDITVTGYDIDPVLDIYGWYGGNVDPARPQDVGGKAANNFGLYDMHGNVAEWCWDWYAPYEEGPLLNPAGPDMGDLKVIRGGDWFYQAKACRSASRETFPPTSGDNRVGFRVIRTLIDE